MLHIHKINSHGDCLKTPRQIIFLFHIYLMVEQSRCNRADITIQFHSLMSKIRKNQKVLFIIIFDKQDLIHF